MTALSECVESSGNNLTFVISVFLIDKSSFINSSVFVQNKIVFKQKHNSNSIVSVSVFKAICLSHKVVKFNKID